MILQELYRYATRKNLADDPAFETAAVDFLIRLDGKGRFLSLEPTQDERGRGLPHRIPRIPKRAVNIAAGFIVDNAKYVLGLGDPEDSDEDRLEKCRAAYRARIAECVDDTHDRQVGAVLHFLDDLGSNLKKVFAVRPRAEWTGSERIAFVVGDEWVSDRPAVVAYWSQRSAGENTGMPVRCLVTGKLAPPTRLHPSIKRVPEAQSSGASVVSFNADAFCSQGLEQGANAPISAAAATGYAAALNYLLAATPKRRFQYGVSIGTDSVCVFWTQKENDTPDLLLSLLDPTEEDAVRFAESPLRGLEPAKGDETPFFAMTLAGNAARVVVRDWLQTTAEAVKRNIRRYFSDLAIGERSEEPIPIWRILQAVCPPGRHDDLRPDVSARLMRAALRGDPFPRELLFAALRRLRLPPDKNAESAQLRIRVALIKATLLRLPRSGLPKLEVTMSLDDKNAAPPYLLGRLFAVLERLQLQALGDVNATIRDRYFGAASMTPALAFPRLIRLSQHHAAKAEAGWLERIKGEIMSALPAEPFPRVLSLEDQGLFAIGYYHQRETFFRKKAEPTPTAETAQ